MSDCKHDLKWIGLAEYGDITVAIYTKYQCKRCYQIYVRTYLFWKEADRERFIRDVVHELAVMAGYTQADPNVEPIRLNHMLKAICD